MKVKVICREFECRKDIHYKHKLGPVAKNVTPRPTRVLWATKYILNIVQQNIFYLNITTTTHWHSIQTCNLQFQV